MNEAPTDGDVISEMPSYISEAARQLHEMFGGNSLRIWRYVDSQMVLFGCPTDGGSQRGEPEQFEERVAFLKDPSILGKYASNVVLQLGDSDDDDPEMQHQLWYVPDYEVLSKTKTVRKGYAEAILLRAPRGEPLTLNDLIGVVCIDAPYSRYREIVEEDARKGQTGLHAILDRLRDELHNYSNRRFRSGFDKAEQYLRAAPRTRDEERATEASFIEPLKGLRKAIDPGPAILSLYLRSVNSGSNEVPLGDGLGEYFQKLLIVETCHRSSPHSEFPKALFSAKAAEQLTAKPNAPPPPNAVLFPGSDGSWKTFGEYRTWFTESSEALKAVPSDSSRDASIAEAAHWVHAHAVDIEKNGSFGVFPIRCMAETSLRGQLVGLLCVAVENRRNFFTWDRRLVIEKFCRMAGRVHDAHIAPILTRIHPDTHRDVIASPPTLEKLLDRRGPLAPRANESERTCRAFVVSVDIRKSTDLMLKVLPNRTQEYADVLMRLCKAMKGAIEAEFGIFDKFTGDGVLAFFPEFFGGSADVAGYRLLRAAERCHSIFAEYYKQFWPYLSTVPAPGNSEKEIPGAIGLGIGIDYGKVRLVNVGDELTVVGAPVVYACRLSGAARAFKTLLNQRAFDVLKNHLGDWEQEPVALKHEDGPTIAYRVVRRKLAPPSSLAVSTSVSEDPSSWRLKVNSPWPK